MEDCIFCKIANKEIPKELLYESEEVVAFYDILPQAPVHIIIIPKDHIPSLNDLEQWHQGLVGEIIYAAKDLAKQHNIAESGYKTIFNVGVDGGQIVPHLHLHLVGGKKLE